jgi:hypothetical protein
MKRTIAVTIIVVVFIWFQLRLAFEVYTTRQMNQQTNINMAIMFDEIMTEIRKRDLPKSLQPLPPCDSKDFILVPEGQKSRTD